LDTIADLSNALIQDKTWNSNILVDPLCKSFFSPTNLSLNIPFKPAKPLIVQIPIKDIGKVDIVIDDFIAITPAI
jgi:hypothetical protein